MPQTGPPIGNVPLPDSYNRLQQNIEGLQTSHRELEDRLSKMDGKLSTMSDQLARYAKLLTVQSLKP